MFDHVEKYEKDVTGHLSREQKHEDVKNNFDYTLYKASMIVIHDSFKNLTKLL